MPEQQLPQWSDWEWDKSSRKWCRWNRDRSEREYEFQQSPPSHYATIPNSNLDTYREERNEKSNENSSKEIVNSAAHHGDSDLENEKSDPRYKISKPIDFKHGTVFKVLWSEPSGSVETVTHKQYGGMFRAKIRRFLVFRDRAPGHFPCLPIMTYQSSGVLKMNMPIKKPGVHAISRLNYAKVYTMEHNVKVWSIGKIQSSEHQSIELDWNKKKIPKLNMHAHTQNDVESGREVSKSEPLWTDRISNKKTKKGALDWELYRDKIKDLYIYEADALSDFIKQMKTPWFPRSCVAREIFLASEIVHGEGINVKNVDTDAQRGRMSWMTDHSEVECTGCEKCCFQELDAILVDEQESDLGDTGKLLLYEEETGQWYLALLENYRHCGKQPKFSDTRAAMVKTVGALALISGLAMGGSSMWLNAKMDLQRLSLVGSWITHQAARLIPPPLRATLGEAPDGAIFMVFAACTALFVATTYAWLNSSVRKWLATSIAMICAMGWMIGGMNAQEFPLIGLPVSIGFGILCGSFLGQHKSCIFPRYSNAQEKGRKEVV